MATAASLIKRFREDKPTSREVRRYTNEGRMWWENDDEETERIASPMQTTKEINNNRAEPQNNLSLSRRSRDMGFQFDRSLNLDSMIEEEIRILERDLKNKDFRTRLDGTIETVPATAPTTTATANPAMNDITLEELLKNLNVVFPSKTDEETEKSIAEIANDLNVHMINFANSYTNMMSKQEITATEILEKERKERDEKMREEGRLQERSKRLLDIDLPILENSNLYLTPSSASKGSPVTSAQSDNNNKNESKVHRSMRAVQLAMQDINSMRHHYIPKPIVPKEETEEDANTWNPYPEIVHKNILTTTKGITSMLSTVITTLNNQLPEPPPTPPAESEETGKETAPAVMATSIKGEDIPAAVLVEKKAVGGTEAVSTGRKPENQAEVAKKTVDQAAAEVAVTTPTLSSSAVKPNPIPSDADHIEFIDKVLNDNPVSKVNSNVFSTSIVPLESTKKKVSSPSSTSNITDVTMPPNLKHMEQVVMKKSQRSLKKVFFNEENVQGNDKHHNHHNDGATAPHPILSYQVPITYDEQAVYDRNAQPITSSRQHEVQQHKVDNLMEHSSPLPVEDIAKYASPHPIRRPTEGMSMRSLNRNDEQFSIHSRHTRHSGSVPIRLPEASSSIVEKEQFLKDLKNLRKTLQASY